MRKFKKFLAELLVACMVIGAVPFTAFAKGMHTVSVTVDPKKGYCECLSETPVASGSVVDYQVKAKYGYEHTGTDIESVYWDKDESFDPETGIYTGEFYMPDVDVTIHPYFKEDGKARYKINFVTEAGTHYHCEVSYIIDEYEEAARAGSVDAAAGDEVTIYATSSDLDYKVVDVDIVGKESSNTVDYAQDGGFYTFTMPDEEVLIYVTEEHKEPAEYAITVDETVENGSIYVESSADSGDTVSFTCYPDNGYALDAYTVSVQLSDESAFVEVRNTVDGHYEFTMPNSDVVIYAYFFDKGQNPHAIKDLSNENCEVSFTKTHAGEGDAIYMFVVPDVDCYIKSVVVSGDTSLDKIDCFVEDYNENYTTYKFVMPDEAVNVRVICEQNYHGQYKIETYCLDDKGSISAPTDADAGDTVYFSVAYTEGWQFWDLYVYPVGGEGFVPAEEDGLYSFEMPAADVTIALRCRTTLHKIDVDEVDPVMGSVVCSAEEANVGDKVTVDITAEQGYKFDSIRALTYDGEEITISQSVWGEQYFFLMPDDDVNLYVVFVPIPGMEFELTKGLEENGSYVIKNERGDVATSSVLGKQITVSYEPVEGYHLSEINITKTIDGVDYQVTDYVHDSANKCITFTMPNGPVNVALSFANTNWTITTVPPTYGEYLVNKASANFDDLISIKVRPYSGYHYDAVTVAVEGGAPIIPRSVGKASDEDPDEWVFNMPNSNVTISVEFVEDHIPAYAINCSSDPEKYTMSASVETADANDTVYLDIDYVKGWQLADLSVYEAGGFVTAAIPEQDEFGDWYFVMPDCNVDVVLTCKTTIYSLFEIHDAKRGTVTLTPADPVDGDDLKAYRGDKVTVDCEPGDGYKFVSILVNEGDVEVTQEQLTDGHQKFSFTMPDGEATVEVDYELNGKLFKFGYDDFYALGSKYAKFIKSFDVADAVTEDPIDIKGGNEGTILPEAKLKATLVLQPGYDLKAWTFTDVDGVFNEDVHSEQAMDEEDCNMIYTFVFEMPNSDIMFSGAYDVSKFIVDYSATPVDTDRDGSVSTDCTLVDEDDNFLATYNSTVSVLTVPATDDVAVLIVEDAKGNPVAHRVAANPNYTWEFTMPDSNVTVEAQFSKAVHTINADTTQSNGTYQVCFEGGAPASAGVRGTQIYIVTSPDEGYEVATVTVAKGSGDEIEYSVPTPNQYYVFTIPDDFTDVEDTVEIAVTFQETIAKICQEAQAALVAPKSDLNTVSGNALEAHDLVIAAKSQAKTQAKKDALSEADTALLAEKAKVDAMIAAIETLEGNIAAVTTDRDAALGYREAANLYAGGYQVLVASCNNAIQATEAPKAIKECLVSFATNGGSAVASQWLVAGTKAVKPEAPTYQGYYFVDWYSDADLKNAFDFNAPIKQNTTIYAGWTKAKAYNGGGSSGGGSVKSSVPTFSKFWTQDAAGTWRIKDKAGNYVVNAWLCDNAVLGNGQNVWYLLNADGSMITAPLVQDNTGNYYSLEMNHNGYYGMLRYKNGVYDGIYMEFSQKHDGTFGAITNQSAIDALKAKYGVVRYGIDNSNSVYTKDFN